jgi:acetyltransferase
MNKLNSIFKPKTVAFIGATDRKGSVGLSISKNLKKGDKERKIFFVNPFRKKVLGKKTFDSVKSIKEEIDLVVIAVPAKVIPGVIEEIIDKKVGGVIIISSGFAEVGREGKVLQEKIVQKLKEAEIPLLGPNCLGILRPANSLNASFAFTSPKQGRIAFVSQSGALVGSIIDKSLIESYGFSTIVSYGNEADVDLCDLLEWLKNDKETRVIGVYLEAVKDGRRFIKVAREVNKVKPIVVLKSGKTRVGQKTALSHTASLSSSHKIYSAVFRQTGVQEVRTMKELFHNLKSLAWQPLTKNNIGIISNSGGCGVLLADACEKHNLRLARLNKEKFKKINKSSIMKREISFHNPVDIYGDALDDRYELVINNLLEQKEVKGLIIAQTLQAMTPVQKNAKIIVDAHKKWPDKPIVCLFMGGKNIASGIQFLEKNKIPNYFDPEEAVLAMKSLIK